MHRWYSIFPKNPWLSIYVWIVFCLLPFFFIFRSSSPLEILIGITLLILFFLSYMFSFKSKSGLVYMWLSFEIIINIAMTLLFSFVYFSLFTAFFIGNIRNTTGFFIMYGLHIITAISAVIAVIIVDIDAFLPQIHFIILCLIGIILLPFHLYNRNRREKLEGELEVANERISELIVFEERQRIARDLHDTLGQKLSLIGLKSDLAGKYVYTNASQAKREIQDIRSTASSALKEVRELVTDMRSKKLSEELLRVQQLLKAAEITLILQDEKGIPTLPPIIEDVLSMCLKETVTNIVKHSFAKQCTITFTTYDDVFMIQVQDDGIGIPKEGRELPGSGMDGMRERVEFVNGQLTVQNQQGTIITITVPMVLHKITQEARK